MQQAGRLGRIKELLFTTKLCLSQVTSPQALLDCHLPRGRGCDIKQTQICQGHRLEHLVQPDTQQASQPADPHSTWQRVCVCVHKSNSLRCIQTLPHTADSHVDCTHGPVTALWSHASSLIFRARAEQTRGQAGKTSSPVTPRSTVWPAAWPHLLSWCFINTLAARIPRVPRRRLGSVGAQNTIGHLLFRNVSSQHYLQRFERSRCRLSPESQPWSCQNRTAIKSK